MIGQPLRAAAERFIRPSSLKAIAACPGRPLMEASYVERFGEPPTEPVAQLGTDGHEIIAAAIMRWKDSAEVGASHGLTVQWEEIIGAACKEATASGVDKWTVACIQSYLEFVRDLIAKHDIEPENVLPEHHMAMDDLGMTGGTADLLLIVPYKLVIIVDAKLGFIDQGDADEHEQIQAYGISAAATFKCSEVLVYLAQPRAEKDRRYTAARLDAATLRANADWTRDVVEAAKAPNPELSPSYAGCLHCKAITRCQAVRRFVVQAQEGVELLGYPTDADEWGRLAAVSKIAEKFGGDAKDAVKQHIGLGGEATGWGLASAGSITKIDVPKALELAKAGGFLDALLAHASLKASAAALVPEATSKEEKAKSLKPVKS